MARHVDARPEAPLVAVERGEPRALGARHERRYRRVAALVERTFDRHPVEARDPIPDRRTDDATTVARPVRPVKAGPSRTSRRRAHRSAGRRAAATLRRTRTAMR